MAKLVKCSFCGHEMANEYAACPNCGYNVVAAIYRKKAIREKLWEAQGLCLKCGSNEFTKIEQHKHTKRKLSEPFYSTVTGRVSWNIKARCIVCDWIDEFNYDAKWTEGEETAPKRHKWGNGLKYGLRKFKN